MSHRLVTGLIAPLALGAALAQDPPTLPEGLGGEEEEQKVTEERPESWIDRLPTGLHGFWESRLGSRLQDDPAQSESLTLAETRLRIDYSRTWGRTGLDLKADVAADGITDGLEYTQRQARVTIRLGEFDLRAGRQVLTWGTGDLLFINDLFPKDWQSFFSGRDVEYLKAPSDSLRAGWYRGGLGVEAVYTPEFEPDRFIDGQRFSFWDVGTGAPTGEAGRVHPIIPADWFRDDEVSLRLFGTFGPLELAAYGYDGFWKSPAGADAASGRATFPRLRVWGASARGPIGPGIANLELGTYDSRDDTSGADPFVDNGELRVLAGYEMELARELTGALQLYLENLRDYGAYRATLPTGPPRDRSRGVATIRLTKLLRNQTVTASFFAYFGLTDRDLYLRPRVQWKIDDHWRVELGANVFVGRDPETFFGQFEDGTNAWAAVRFSG